MLASMGATVWYFLRPPSGELYPVACAAVEAFFAGKASLPADPDGSVRYVEVAVRLEHRRAVEVLRVGYFQQRVGRGGKLDQRHLREVMAVAGEATFGGLGVTRPPAGIIAAEHRFAGRRLAHLSQWQPTTAEVAAIQRLVNQKAGRAVW
jgi:hypothetical protein